MNPESLLQFCHFPSSQGCGKDKLEINFIFLVVGHTKNAADHLFKSLKVMYRKKNLYTTFDQLVEALGTSRTITVHPTVSEDFLNYGKLFDFFYKKTHRSD